MNAPRRLSAAEARRVERRIEAATKPTARALAVVTRRSGLTSSGLIVLGLAVVCWGLAYVAGGRPLFLLSYASLAVLALAYALTNRPIDLQGTRAAVRPRVAEGEEVEIELALTGGKRFSTFVLEEEVPPTLGDSPRVSIASFVPGTDLHHTYRVTLWRRGAYQLGPLVVKWGDPFGLTQRRRVLAEPFEVLVHPATELVQERPLTRMWEDPPVRPPVSKPWPTGSEFYGMREYVRGDDTRRIVWRAFARTGRLLVRESEQGVTDKLTILLDTDRRTHSPGAISESFEAGVKAAASIAQRHLDQGYNVTFESNLQREVGPVRGPGARLPMLDAMARADRSRAPLTDGISRLTFTAERDAQIVLITPLLDDTATAQLQLLVERGSSVLVAALMWGEDAVDTLVAASALGAHVVELRPNGSMTRAFARGVVGVGR